MKLLLTSFILLCFTLTYSQTNKERAQIIEYYNLTTLNEIKLKLTLENQANNKAIEDYIKKHGLEKSKKDTNGSIMKIRYIIDGKPVYLSTDNVEAAKSTKTNQLHNGGGLGLNLEGQNMNMAAWDSEGVLTTHQEFLNSDSSASRATKGELFFANISDHATHVAGTLIGKGTNPSAKGMAPKATLTLYNWDDDTSEVVTEITTNALLLSNHSYGVPVLNSTGDLNVPKWMMGCYNSDAVNWDQIAYNAPYYLQVTSAGNSGEDTYSGGLKDGYDKLTTEKNAKNNLVIANANPVFGFLSINSSSSQGPSDDGRIKPDIAGDGTNLTSSTVGSNSEYKTFSGTSMASPNVAGSLLLLQQYYNELNSSYMKSATLKGLVCHTAVDDISKIGPDAKFGYGLLDAKASVETILAAANGTALIKETSLANGNTYSQSFTVSNTNTLSATICWTDPPGTDQSGVLNSPIPALVNDLDLRLTAPDGTTTFFPWKLQLSDVSAAAITGDNTVDTLENIDIKNPIAGTYTVSVTHKGSLINGTQAFSLILTGSNLTLGVSDKLISSVNIWPNPVNDHLNLSFESSYNKTKISLYDVHGREIYKKYLETNNSKITHSIDTKMVHSGIYFLNIQNGNASFKRKIIIN
ncbi:S8 family serine peptidase [Mariniflexile sp. AS56]|uniref:S8 family serine peptidase n=1 Tax=Mariniflexile sp. AS56 TaxID=3063957 RepID=UPI0026EB746C|nr:S8 family serine peptidase [Mariniflexile sp. AS56]MDO7170754.1 S8 family serine peptidase [Mariniflexile sp. AS56]